MFIDEEYYLDEEARFYKEQEEKFYRLQRQEAQKHYKKKHSFEEALYEFEAAVLWRCVNTYDDYLQPFPCYRHNNDLIELINQMRKKFPKEKRFSYIFLKDKWKDEFSYFGRDDWYHQRSEGQWVTGKGTHLMEEFFTNVLLDYLEKTKKYRNNSKPTFIIEAPKTPIIEPKKEEPVIVQTIVEEKIVNGKGRPKGSKNKKQEEMKPPTHKIEEKTIVAALQDIIWYAEGLKANEIFKYLEADESITKKIYGKLHENAGKLWDKRVCGTLQNGAKIERYYPLTPRKGYFYNGEIHTLSSLATLTGIAKQTLSYRISKGVNHIDAINKEINENMRRK